MQANIRTKSGSLSAYGFACGYVERFGEFVTLSEQHGTYHVKCYPKYQEGYIWSSHDTLTEARRAARRLAR